MSNVPPDEYTMWLERSETGKNVEELEKAFDGLLQRIKRVDPLTLAEMANAKYRADGVPRIIVPFLHSWFVLEFLPYRIHAEHPDVDTLPMKVLVLQHLLAAAENVGTAVRVMGQWIDIRSLRHGSVMGAHFARTTTEILDKFFALGPDQQVVKAMKWGGKPIELADRAFVFSFFPRLPVAFIHWQKDEEFPPYSKILYDISASNYMPTHGLAALTEFLIHRLAET